MVAMVFRFSGVLFVPGRFVVGYVSTLDPMVYFPASPWAKFLEFLISASSSSPVPCSSAKCNLSNFGLVH